PDQGAEVAAVPARGEHDLDVAAVPGDRGRDREAVGVGELDVEQDDVGRELAGGAHAVCAAPRLADHVEALRFEQRPRPGAEAGVVVDDQDAKRHAAIVAYAGFPGDTGSHTLSGERAHATAYAYGWRKTSSGGRPPTGTSRAAASPSRTSTVRSSPAGSQIRRTSMPQVRRWASSRRRGLPMISSMVFMADSSVVRSMMKRSRKPRRGGSRARWGHPASGRGSPGRPGCG